MVATASRGPTYRRSAVEFALLETPTALKSVAHNRNPNAYSATYLARVTEKSAITMIIKIGLKSHHGIAPAPPGLPKIA